MLPTDTPSALFTDLSNAVDFLLVCLCDVQDSAVGQSDGCSPLQHGLHRSLTHSVLYPRHLTMHGTTRHDSYLTEGEKVLL